MSPSFAYDQLYDPPAPMVRLRIADPRGEAGVLLPGLIDTGADCTLIPLAIAHQLNLPQIGDIEIVGIGGGGGRAPLHAALVEIAGAGLLARLVAFADETIVGRDLLNRVAILLDGPRLRLRLSTRRRL